MTVSAGKTKIAMRRLRGSVTLEFALTFPLVLILFCFAWQILNYYNADILGSYAAFASARAFAVFRYNGGWEDDTEAQQRSVQIARSVAVCIMGIISPPVRSASGFKTVFEDQSFYSNANKAKTKPAPVREQIRQSDDLKNLMIGAIADEIKSMIRGSLTRLFNDLKTVVEDKSLFPSREKMLSAWRRMSDFRVVEYWGGTPIVYTISESGLVERRSMDEAASWCSLKAELLDGYQYPGNDAAEESADLKDESLPDKLRNWVSANLDKSVEQSPVSSLWKWLQEKFGKKKEPKIDRGRTIRVGQVYFRYELPLWFAFARMNLFSGEKASKEDTIFSLYQTCACPLEPALAPDEVTRDMPTKNEEKEAELRKRVVAAELALKKSLAELCAFVHEKFWYIKKDFPNSHYDYDHEPPTWSPANTLVPFRGQRERDVEKLYDARGSWVNHPSLDTTVEFEELKRQYQNPGAARVDDVNVNPDIDESGVAEVIDQWARLWKKGDPDWKRLIDLAGMIGEEVKYRDDVKAAIEKETSQLEGVIKAKRARDKAKERLDSAREKLNEQNPDSDHGKRKYDDAKREYDNAKREYDMAERVFRGHFDAGGFFYRSSSVKSDQDENKWREFAEVWKERWNDQERIIDESLKILVEFFSKLSNVYERLESYYKARRDLANYVDTGLEFYSSALQ